MSDRVVVSAHVPIYFYFLAGRVGPLERGEIHHRDGQFEAGKLGTGLDAASASQDPAGFVVHHPLTLARKAIKEVRRPVFYPFQLGQVILFSGLVPFGLCIAWKPPAVL